VTERAYPIAYGPAVPSTPLHYQGPHGAVLGDIAAYDSATHGPRQGDDEKLRDENDAGATLTASPG